MGATGGAPGFADLSPALRDRIANAGRRASLAYGETVFRRGDRPDGIYILLDGRIKLEAIRGDKERVIEVIEAGRSAGRPP